MDQQLLVDYNQLEIEANMTLKQFYEKTKLLFESIFLPCSDDNVPQRVPNVPSGFLSTKHR
jgi:hypothetical protein